MVEMFYEDENFKKQMKCRSEIYLVSGHAEETEGNGKLGA